HLGRLDRDHRRQLRHLGRHQQVGRQPGRVERGALMAAQPPPARPPLRMSRQLGWYVALVAAAGLGVIATSLWALPGTPRATEWLLLASAGVLAGAYGLKIPGVDVRISVSDTFFLALAVLFGPAAATVGTAIDCAATSWRR